MTVARLKPASDTLEQPALEPVATHEEMVNAIRMLAADAVEKAKSGHPGMPMGMANAATVLWTRFLKFDPTKPDWEDRDRFILSAGHGSMLLYALLYLTGYEELTLDEIRNFRQLGSKTSRASGVRGVPRHRDNHGATRARSRQCGRHGPGRAAA